MNGGWAAVPIEGRRRRFRLCTRNEGKGSKWADRESDGWNNTSRVYDVFYWLLFNVWLVILVLLLLFQCKRQCIQLWCLQSVLCKQFYFLILEMTKSKLLVISKYLASGVIPNLGEGGFSGTAVVATHLHSVFVEKQVHLQMLKETLTDWLNSVRSLVLTLCLLHFGCSQCNSAFCTVALQTGWAVYQQAQIV